MTDLLNSLSTVNQSSSQTSLDLISQEKNPSKAEVSKQKLSDDMDNFLLLLTTQLKNQDPTEPLDVNQFTDQLVAFSGVEQQIATNENLEKMITAQGNSQLTNAVNYVGQFVDAKGNAGQLSGGFASFAYEMDIPAAKVNLIITDGAGRAVYSGEGPTGSGKNRVVWDGVNSFNGNTETDGTYFINVVAKNSKDETITSRTFTTGPVTGAEIRNGEVILSVAGSDVKLTDVLAIRQPLQLPSGGDPDDGTDVASNEDDETTLLDDVVDGAADLVDEIL